MLIKKGNVQKLERVVDSVQGIVERIRMLLQNKYQKEKHIVGSPVWVYLPVRIDYVVMPLNKVFYSIELVKQFKLENYEANTIQKICNETNATKEELLLELMREIVSQKENIRAVVQQTQEEFDEIIQISVRVHLNGKFKWERLHSENL